MPMHLRRWRQARGAVTALAAITALLPLAPHAAASATERQASDSDSQEARWSVASPSHYHDVIRKTDRVTYSDGGIAPITSCDATGDGLPDVIMANSKTRTIGIVPYIPYGSSSEEMTRTISQQPEVHILRPPRGVRKFAHHIACTGTAGSTHLLISADDNIWALKPSQIAKSSVINPTKTLHLSGEPTALSGSMDGAIYAASGKRLIGIDKIPDTGRDPVDLKPNIKWLAPVNIEALTWLPSGFSPTPSLAIGLPEKSSVTLLPIDSASGVTSTHGVSIASDPKSRFGHSITAMDDINNDSIPDLAIGAPQANGKTGAVAIVHGARRPANVNVKVSGSGPLSVIRQSENAGTILRQPGRGRIGSGLAWINGDQKHPGALVVGRPDHEEHPGAVIISSAALSKGWDVGRGIEDIPSSQIAFMAASDNSNDDAGVSIGTIPRRGEDNLHGILTVNSTGAINLWTVDLSHQGEKSGPRPVEPNIPEPPAPTAQPALTPQDSPTSKSWLGPFTSGMGGSLARGGSCDVTGDHRPDIVSSGAPRSEWKFDPLYSDSTPTKGWLPNVTGQIQVIPSGAKGQEIPNDSVIQINGPRDTGDPSVDAEIGLSVACLGDTNGDHVDDIAVSSFTMGRVWVIYGGANLPETDLQNPTPNRVREIILPKLGSPGFQVSRMGDINNDGLSDVGFVIANSALAVGELEKNHGSAIVVAGARHNPGSVDLTNLKDPPKEVILKIDQPSNHTMSSFAAVGDVNGDGREDFVVADFNYIRNNSIPGKAWVVFGTPRRRVSLERQFSGYVLDMHGKSNYRLGAGASIAAAGDVNLDGIDDFIIGFDGGFSSHETSGGVAIVHGNRSVTKRRLISPDDISMNDPEISIIRADVPGTGFGSAADVEISSQSTPGWLAVGAWNEGDGALYLIHIQDIPNGINSMSKLKRSVIRISSSGARARFGRSVAMVGDYLGSPTVAAGGDGVIDQDGQEGYAHSAHVRALMLPKRHSSVR